MAVNNLPPSQLKEILAAMANKNEAAFEFFFKHYRPQIFRFARSLVRDDCLAEEISSDALLEVCRRPLEFNSHSLISTYLCSIAINKVIDADRKTRSIPERVDMEHPDVLSIADAQPWSDVEKQVDDRKTSVAFHQCIDKLPEKLRMVAALTVLEECVETEVAKLLGCPVGTVKSRWSSARTSLKKCLGSWYRGIKNG